MSDSDEDEELEFDSTRVNWEGDELLMIRKQRKGMIYQPEMSLEMTTSRMPCWK